MSNGYHSNGNRAGMGTRTGRGGIRNSNTNRRVSSGTSRRRRNSAVNRNRSSISSQNASQRRLLSQRRMTNVHNCPPDLISYDAQGRMVCGSNNVVENAPSVENNLPRNTVVTRANNISRVRIEHPQVAKIASLIKSAEQVCPGLVDSFGTSNDTAGLNYLNGCPATPVVRTLQKAISSGESAWSGNTNMMHCVCCAIAGVSENTCCNSCFENRQATRTVNQTNRTIPNNRNTRGNAGRTTTGGMRRTRRGGY